MAKIPVSYQPNKIKKGSYTDWIDGGKFCSTTNVNGTSAPPAAGLNLLDAFDVDWSAYKIGNFPASATRIIDALNAQDVVPKEEHKLIYFGKKEGAVEKTLFVDQLMYEKGYVVDNDEDFAKCTEKEPESPDLINEWQQFSYSNYCPEYGIGLSTSNQKYNSGNSIGYGKWTADGTSVQNAINSRDYNGYLNTQASSYINFVQTLGCYQSNTTGDWEGVALVNDSNAIPRRVVDSNGIIYYRNTLFDKAYDAAGWQAWATDGANGNTYVIYGVAEKATVTGGSYQDAFPSGTVNVYIAKGRQNKEDRLSTAYHSTCTIASSHEADGYIAVLNILQGNSEGNDMLPNVTGGGQVGTIYIFSEIYNLTPSGKNESYKKVNTQSNYYYEHTKANTQSTVIINGDSSNSNNPGQLLVEYKSAFNSNSASNPYSYIKSNLHYKDNVLTLQFSDVVSGKSAGLSAAQFLDQSDSIAYNGSLLVLDFNTKKYNLTPRSTSTASALTNVDIPSGDVSVTVAGVTETIDWRDLFKGPLKIMYFAHSQQYLSYKVEGLGFHDRTVIRQDEDKVYQYNVMAGEYAETDLVPTEIFTGSHLHYNDITNVLWSSNGKSITKIVSGSTSEETTYHDRFLGFINSADTLNQSITLQEGDYWIASDSFPIGVGTEIGSGPSILPGYFIVSKVTGEISSALSLDSFKNTYKIVSLPYIPLSGTQKTGPLTGSIGIDNCSHFIDDAIPVLDIHLQDDLVQTLYDDATIIPFIGLNYKPLDSDETLRLPVLDICFKDQVSSGDFPMIGVPYGLCPSGQAGSFIGHADEPFSHVYANHFIGAFAQIGAITADTVTSAGIHSTASLGYSNVLSGINDPGSGEVADGTNDGVTDMGSDITKNGYPLVVTSTGSSNYLVMGPGDIYAVQKKEGEAGYETNTLYLQHRIGYYGDVLIGRNLTVGYEYHGGTGGNLSVKGTATAKSGFIKEGYSDEYVLLAGGGATPLSSISTSVDLSGYLPLSGGTMSGNITFSENTSIVFNLRGEISQYGQNGLCLGADSAEVALEQGHIMLTGTKVKANCNVEAAAFFETSDIRKKEIKSDLSLEKCYDVIDKCQTIIYSLKDQTTEQIGMIAQEIEEFFPEVVATDEEGFKSLAYDRLVVICFKVLKDVIKRLEHLENGL